MLNVNTCHTVTPIPLMQNFSTCVIMHHIWQIIMQPQCNFIFQIFCKYEVYLTLIYAAYIYVFVAML